MATQAFNLARTGLLQAQFNLFADTIKVALMVPTFVPDFDLNEFWSDVSASEAAGTGYTAGGVTLASKTVTLDATADRAVFDAADASWIGLTISTASAVIYKDTGTPTTSKLLGFVDFGGTRSPSAENWAIIWDAAGVIRL